MSKKFQKLLAFVTALALLLVAGLSGHYQDVIASSYGTLDISSIIPGTGATNQGKAEDAAHASGDTGVAAWAVRKDGNDTALCADGDYSVLTCNDVGNLKVQIEPTRKATYMADSGFVTLAASCTDAATLAGSGSKTIKVQKIFITPKSTGGSTVSDTWFVIKRSALDTTGTATTLAAVPLDSNNAAASATAKVYTANPGALGTAVGTVSTYTSIGYFVGNLVTHPPKYPLFDADKFGQPIVLRGTSENIVVNLNGVTQAGTSPTFNVTWVWTEE